MAKKQKCLTQQEKQTRARVKKELQASGFLPPDKPRLNRKRFKEEVQRKWSREMDLLLLSDDVFFDEAISWMLASSPSAPVTPEQVGVLKTMKIAMELKRLYQRAREEGGTCTLKEVYHQIKPIMDL